MVNNSEKLYYFQWEPVEHLLIKPTIGYISPGEEKDIEITFFSIQPVSIKKVFRNRVKRFFKYDPLLVLTKYSFFITGVLTFDLESNL